MGTLSTAARLFSESPSRIVVSFDSSNLGQMEEIAARAGCEFALLGRVSGKQLIIKADGDEVVNVSIAELEKLWRSSLESNLKAEALTINA